MEQALDDPYGALVDVLETTMSLTVRHHRLLTVAMNVRVLTMEGSAPFYDSLTRLVRRAQDAGAIRDDLGREDLYRIMVMLAGVLQTMPPEGDGWRRYLALVLDALRPGAAHPLPPVVPLLHDRSSGDAIEAAHDSAPGSNARGTSDGPA
jgi:hypothetical protein